MVLMPKLLEISGTYSMDFDIFDDERGMFREWFKKSLFSNTPISFDVAQANVSVSKRGAIRGIHYSLAPKGQAKWVTCISGVVEDVLIDLRLHSPTFLKVLRLELNSAAGTSIYIPTGVGHGFVAREENSTVAYLLSSEYDPQNEYGINPLDKYIGIEWGEKNPIVSKKDSDEMTFIQRQDGGFLPTFS